MTGPKSKTAAFFVALLGPDAVQPGATFTMNDLIGKTCLIQTDLNDSGYAKVIGAHPCRHAAVRPTAPLSGRLQRRARRRRAAAVRGAPAGSEARTPTSPSKRGVARPGRPRATLTLFPRDGESNERPG